MTNYEWLVTKGELKNFVRKLYSLFADTVIDKYEIPLEESVDNYNEDQKLAIITDWLQKERQEILKSCPFCGGDGEIINTQPYVYYVRCKICKGRSNVFEIANAAIEKWNRRVEK